MGCVKALMCVKADDLLAEIQTQGRLAGEGWSEQFAGESTHSLLSTTAYCNGKCGLNQHGVEWKDVMDVVGWMKD